MLAVALLGKSGRGLVDVASDIQADTKLSRGRQFHLKILVLDGNRVAFYLEIMVAIAIAGTLSPDVRAAAMTHRRVTAA
jgi:hypothetical protein